MKVTIVLAQADIDLSLFSITDNDRAIQSCRSLMLQPQAVRTNNKAVECMRSCLGGRFTVKYNGCTRGIRGHLETAGEGFVYVKGVYT